MAESSHLFPNRLNRRDFLATSTALAATAAAGSTIAGSNALADDANAAAIRIGLGSWTFEYEPTWGMLPNGMKYGHGCGIVVDSRDCVYVTSRSANPCVAVFSPSGELLETWGKDFGDHIGYSVENIAATAHGIYWSKEGNNEYLFFTENVSGGKDGQPKIGARVYKTDLTGKVLHTIGNVDKETSSTQKFDWTNPTDVAVAPNGDIYVVDGYGSQRVSRFDKDFNHIKTIGGRGKDHGQFNVCHGVWINTIHKEPEVYIADRANGRYEIYSMELEYKRTVAGDFVRNPCCFYQHDGHLYIPDLASMVTVIDGDDKPVAVLGDGKMGDKNAPDRFAAPHALTLDSKGNLYVLEWVPTGRVRKFKRITA